MSHRVVVTGMGAVTPLGLDAEQTWEGMVAGRSGIAGITHFDTTGFDVTFAGEVKGFDPEQTLDRKDARRTDRFIQFAVAATAEALQRAGLAITDDIAPDIGTLIGSGIGGIGTLSEQYDVFRTKGPGRVSPFLVPMMIPDMASGQVSIRFGMKGPNYATVSACSSGADAIGNAFETIRRGECVAMIAGGAEAAIVPIGIAGFISARALSKRNDEPQRASRPFDAERDGFVMGEGAGILVLERLDFALARGANIVAEVAGYGSTADAFHLTHPPDGGEGAARAMRKALGSSGLAPGDIQYVNAHGTSTQLNDAAETLALKAVFGEYAYQLAISSTKSMTGHLLGAAGAIEAVASLQAIRDGIVPPTVNYEHPDPDCDLDYTPNEARRMAIDAAISNSFGFGGHNASLVFRRYRGNGAS